MIVTHRPLHYELAADNVLHVIAVISNPARYQSRYRLYEEFAARLASVAAVHLITVELAFGDRKFEITDDGEHDHLRLRSSHELWHKENLINLGVRLLPRDWKYVAWVDCDVEFLNPHWAQETLQQLQHHPIVQMFEDAVDLGPRNNVVEHHKGFGSRFVAGDPAAVTHNAAYRYSTSFWHPGFAWACRREFYENVGGLMDFAILGAADHHMALALVGKAAISVPGGVHPNYRKAVMEWERKAMRACNFNIGFTEGTLLHHWHGPKKRRYYLERWGMLTEHQYDPTVDIKYDGKGVLELNCNHKPELRNDLHRYFNARYEDSRDGE